jgi:hypothetical protein
VSKIDNGGPAFPATALTWNDRLSQYQDGMSLRDWFAGQALMGLLSGQFRDSSRENFTTLPGEAYAMADAMLESRKVKP